MKKKFLIAVLLLSLFLLSSCYRRGGADYQPNPKTERFYSGSEGVRMLMDLSAPPSRLYYYSDAVDHTYNSFDIGIELHNVGASWAMGGYYVSGYDPTLIFLEGVNIPRTNGGFFDNCQIDFQAAGWSWDSLGGIFNCNFGDSGLSLTGDPYSDNAIDGVQVDNLFQLFGWDNMPEIDFGWNSQTGMYNFGFDFSSFGLNFDAMHHGQSLLLILSSLSFDRFNGQEFILAPDNYQYPGGESTFLTFPGYIQNTWPQGLDETDVTFLLTTCYAYTTYATPIVCVDPMPFTENEKVCRPGQIDLKSSQGAPVAITRIIQENTLRSIIFTIEIRNVGTGDIIYPGHLELCSPYYPGRLGVQSMDTVILGDIRMSGSPTRLRCTPDDNIIRLRDGRGQITCTYDLEYATTKSAYNAPLVVELWYGYSQTLRKNVRIKRVS